MTHEADPRAEDAAQVKAELRLVPGWEAVLEDVGLRPIHPGLVLFVEPVRGSLRCCPFFALCATEAGEQPHP